MAVVRTVKSGDWHDNTVWDLGRKPTAGDRAIVNHLLFASDKVTVGDGSTKALELGAPLVCYSDLSVIGRIVSNSSTAGLFFLKPSLDWVFYASAGFQIPPMSQQALIDLWNSVFGNNPPQGYLFPIAGYINTETVFMPNQHPISDAIKIRLTTVPQVLNSHLDPANPKNAVIVYLSALSDTGLINPTVLLSLTGQISQINTSATDINDNYKVKAVLLIEPKTFIYLWAKGLVGNAVLRVTETTNAYTVWVAQTENLNDTVLMLSALLQGLNAVRELLMQMELGKEIMLKLL